MWSNGRDEVGQATKALNGCVAFILQALGDGGGTR